MKDALEALSEKLEGKTKAQIQTELKGFEVKYEEVLASMTDFSTKFDELKKEYEDKIEAQQKHIDNIDVKLQSKTVKEQEAKDPLTFMIKNNFDIIKDVTKKGKIYLESKTVGNMTLGNNLTGDQPRTFSNTVAIIPNQILNFSELIGSINIGNGTYTFPREGAGEGAAATQTEGSDKAQIDTDITMVDVNTDFIAGYSVYSRKMANNLPFLESFLPGSLRRKYFDAENSVFNTALAAAATASSSTITGSNKVEMLMNDKAALAASNFPTTAFIVTPADYDDILKTEKSTGAGYGVPGGVTIGPDGTIRILGIPLYQANWLAANKYYVGDWSTISKVVTEGLGLQFSTEDEDNFRKNNITARVEAQVGLAIHRPDAIIYGDFTTT